MSENLDIVSDTQTLTREEQLAMWLRKKNEKVEKPNPLTPIHANKITRTEEPDETRKVIMDLSQMEITPFKGTKKSLLKSQQAVSTKKNALPQQPNPVAHNSTPFRHILNIASNPNTSLNNATTFKQPTFTAPKAGKPEIPSNISNTGFNATPFKQPQIHAATPRPVIHSATPLRQPQVVTNSHAQTPFKVPTKLSVTSKKPNTPNTFWTQKEWTVKDQCEMAIQLNDYEKGHDVFDAIYRKHHRWIKTRAFFWLSWGQFEENFSQIQFAMQLYERGILNAAQPLELIVDALNRITTGKDENNKTLFEMEEEAFGTTTIDMIKPTYAMSPARTAVCASPRPSPRLNNLRLLGTPTGVSKGPALRVPKISEKLNFADNNLEDIHDGLELDSENEKNEEEQNNHENIQEQEQHDHDFVEIQEETEINEQQNEQGVDMIEQANEMVEQMEDLDDLPEQFDEQQVHVEQVDEDRQLQNSEEAPSLRDCRNVLHFLSANNIPIAGYLLRTYNDLKTINDMKELIANSHAQNKEVHVDGYYEENNEDDDAVRQEETNEEDFEHISINNEQLWENEEDSDDVSEDEESDEEDSVSLSQIICEQLSSYGHTYIYSGLTMSSKKGNVIPSTPVRRSHRLLKTPHK